MDILTQSLLGGVLAQSVAGKDENKRAALVGVVAGLLADADILISSSNDPLLNIEYHRHFSHSLLFIPFGAAIAFLLLRPFMRWYLSPKRLYIYCLAGYSMSGLLDACTSYGTHLLWPFSDERIAWNIISIIDPVFTVLLFVTLVLGLRIKRWRVAVTGLVLSLMYLGLGFVQLQRAQDMTHALVSARQHTAEQLLVKPTLGNLLLWRSVYIHDDRIYVDAVRVGLVSNSQIYEGESVLHFKQERDLPDLDHTSALHDDIQRFVTFSDGFVAFDPGQENVLGDIRYSMLPNNTKPLWGIVINSEQPEVHADYRFFRDGRKSVRQTFVNMLLGDCAGVEC